jgi:hypothetical protein
MSGRNLSLLVLLAAFATLAAGRAHSETRSSSVADTALVPQMIPLNDGRDLGAMADYMGVHGEDARYPAGFDPWTPGEAEAIAEEVHPCDDGSGEFCSNGYAHSYAFQFSQFFGQAIQFDGGSSGGWVGDPSGTYSAHSLASFRFRMEVPFTYRLFARVVPGDTPGYIVIEGPTPDVKYFYTAGGALPDSGQLGPGEYVVEGFSSVGPTSEEDTQGTTYSLQWEVDPYIYRALGLQPGDQTVACGGTATFSVGTIGSPGGVTYQWRRNLSPLANNGRISGSTASTLVIGNACNADAGTYDVIVTSSSAPGGPVVEMSRQARLTISTATGVAGVALEPRAFTVSAAAPNPFGRETRFRYDTPSPTRVTMAIYNVAGARVQVLMDREVSGTGTVAWDGTTRAGARAPAGIYYLRADAGARHEHRKIVLLK